MNRSIQQAQSSLPAGAPRFGVTQVLRVAVTLSFVQLAPVEVADAQSPEPYSEVSLFAGVHQPVGSSFFDAYWVADPGLAASIATPFYFGELEVGASARRFVPTSNRYPPFEALVAHVGWNLWYSPSRYIAWAAGPRVGMHFMRFDVETFRGARNEAEVVLGVHTRLWLRPLRWVGVFAGIEHMKTFTYVRLTQTWGSAGLSISLSSPEWLVKVLR